MPARAWLLPLLLAGCAAAGGAGAAPAASPAAGGEPILFHRVVDGESPHPTLLLSWDTAQAVGANPGGFADPALVDQLAAACGESLSPRECRQAVRICREKLCRVERTVR